MICFYVSEKNIFDQIDVAFVYHLLTVDFLESI